MPVTSIAQARDDILTVFRDAWNANTAAIVGSVPEVRYHEAEVAEVPPSDEYWCLAAVTHVDGGAAALGNRIFEHAGLFTAQIYGLKEDQGNQKLDALVKVVLDAFEGQYSANGVWFRNVRVNEEGPVRNWFQVNVIAEFLYTVTK